MELNAIRDLLGRTKGVEGFVILDNRGAILSQDLGSYANEIKRTEFATWILNSFHALDTYYPQAFFLLLRYASGQVYLTRSDSTLITVMCRYGADLQSIETAFSKHRQSMAKSNSSGIVREKSQKGETVFLKISETGSGATSSPIPQKKSGPPVPLIIGLAVGLLVIGIGAFFLTQGPGGETSPEGIETPVTQTPPTTAAPVPSTPAGATEADAATARERADSLAVIARQHDGSNRAPKDMARAVANYQSAQDDFSAGRYEDAIKHWDDSASSYGQASVNSAEVGFRQAVQQEGLEVASDYPIQLWIEAEDSVAKAQDMANAGNYTEAVDLIVAQADKLPRLKAGMLKQFHQLALDADKSKNLDAALDFYRKVLALDPDNATARNYFYANRYEPGQVVSNTLGMSFAYIPPGRFERGSPPNEAFRDGDETQSTVTLTKGFFMATTEVTQHQWEQVMGQKMRMDDPNPDFVGGQLPVHSITWEQAIEFCRRLSEQEGKVYRLPSEAEWEYATRAGTTAPYNNGKIRLTSREANIYDPAGEGLDSVAAVASVGTPNAWGLYDMHGNVWEWTADWSAPYADGPQVDPAGPNEAEDRVDLAMKIVRGGSFLDDSHVARSANRSEASPVVANSYTGFRPVLEVADL
ncbi:MAG: SUMF1/EgtB/PvdO family nonheme iron enzyme [Verrucomicrobiota bacterium]